MLNIFGHKGNANQIYIEILSHPSQKAIINNTNTNAGKDVGTKEPFYTVSDNVN
jgi:hypothetical protein